MLVIAAAAAIGSPEMQAQITFDKLYGHDDFEGAGYNRVIPVTGDCKTVGSNTGCQPSGAGTHDGYLAVGVSEFGAGGTDALIVRIDNNGTIVWEKYYNIGGSSRVDSAWSVVELADGSGFAVVGTTEQAVQGGGTQMDIFVMIIDCEGNSVALDIFGTVGTNNQYGRDIIQATNGNGVLVTGYPVAPQAGDLVIAGWQDGGVNGTADGVLFRVSSAAATLLSRAWDRAYDLGGATSTSSEFFHALTEAQAAGAGDIIVCGVQDDPTATVEGIIGRVNGNTGLVGAAPQGFGTYGSAGTEELYSVIELQQQANAWPTGLLGGIVAVGRTNTPTAGLDDIFVVVLPTGTPCSGGAPPPIFISIDDFNSPATFIEVARCVREVSAAGVALNFAATGDLILTGSTDQSGSEDMFLLPIGINGTTLASGGAFLYGVASNDNNRGYSLAQVTATQDQNGGVILCGLSQLDARCSPTDPEDLELVKTDANGAVADENSGECSDEWPVDDSPRNWTEGCPAVATLTPLVQAEVTPTAVCRLWECTACFESLNKRSIGHDGDREHLPSVFSELMIHSHPNPVMRGELVTLKITPVVEAPAVLRVVDIRGRTISTMRLPATDATSEVTLSTEGWTSGSYMITVANGGRVDGLRLIILE